MNMNGSKPCPHCSKTISMNKDMCFEGIQAFGTLKNFLESQKAAKKVRKPRTTSKKKKVDEDLPTLDAAADENPTPKKRVRKTKTTEPVAV